MNKPTYYLTVDEYLTAMESAHREYLQNRYQNSLDREHHITDLAIESASFYEAALPALDYLTSVIRTKSINWSEFKLPEEFHNMEQTSKKRKGKRKKKH